jgi:16S rRNA (cytosine1402-N4)-methyltransferase
MRTFQALRILVNDEMSAIRQLLRLAPQCLRPGGRIGVISFHSGEDRLVKKAFREGYRQGVYEAYSGQVIRPGSRELHRNPRSSSAKFRWARIGAAQDQSAPLDQPEEG